MRKELDHRYESAGQMLDDIDIKRICRLWPGRIPCNTGWENGFADIETARRELFGNNDFD